MKLCSRCKERESLPTNCYCRECRNAWMRENRPALTPKGRVQLNASAYLHVYVKRGKVAKGPCEVCGTRALVEGHHEDYARPLVVRWLCRKHHADLHRIEPVKTV